MRYTITKYKLKIMNLFKKGIYALLVTGLIISCEDEYELIKPADHSTGPGLTEISFSSFEAEVGPDENGMEDGTFVTVTPLAIGATSYEVDFGTGAPVTIEGVQGSATFDYPNDKQEVTYTITVTAESDKGLASVTKTTEMTIEHQVTAVSSVPDSPTILDKDVVAIFSDGYSSNVSGVNFEAGTAEFNEASVGGNKVIQYSRLDGTNTASITFSPAINIADVFIVII